MPFDHATIVTEDLESARRFLCAIVGLSEGPRPGFGVGGHWLYANGQPVIHLIEKPAASSAISAFGPTDPVELRVNPLGTLSRLAQQGLERHRLSRVLDYIDANLEGELTL